MSKKKTKQEAKELIEKFSGYADDSTYGYDNKAKEQCALICINHTLSVLESIPDLKVSDNTLLDMIESQREVKTEIENYE